MTHRPWLRATRTRGAVLRAAALMAVLAGASAPTSARAETAPYRPQAIEVERERAGLLWARFDADTRLDMLVIGDTQLKLRLQRADGTFADPVVLDVGAALGGALVDVCDLDGDGVSEVALLHAGGVDLHVYDPKQRAWVARAPALLEGMRGIGFLHLTPDDFLYDRDGDGDEDLVYPVDGRIYLYTNQDGTFTRSGEIETSPASVALSVARPRLAGMARTRVQLPRLRVEGESGEESRVEIRLADGRYVRSRDGAAALQGEYVVERGGADPLERFKRRHGIELKGNETFQAILRDLDEDGHNDYTIVYKNRIWVYRGTVQGFDFDRAPDQLVKVSAADRISVLLLPLNDDARPDLVLFKYRIPSVGRLVAALAIGLRSEVEVLGYFNDGKPVFSRRPNERSTLVVRVPPLLQLAGELEDLVDRFRDIVRPMQGVTSGDFDGDGRDDVLRLAGEQMEIYLTREGEPTPIDLASARGRDFLQRYEGHKLVRGVLFEQRRRDVTIDAAMSLASDVVKTLQTAIVGDRQPELRIGMQPEAARRVDQILSEDLNGDTRDDIIVYVEPDRAEEEKRGVAGETQTLYLWLSDALPVAGGAALPEPPPGPATSGRARLAGSLGGERLGRLPLGPQPLGPQPLAQQPLAQQREGAR